MNKRPFTLGVEIEIDDPEKFLLIKESLTRIGIAFEKTKVLYQTAHILHKRNRYYICHFKELFELDGQESLIDDEDIARRNLIAYLLQDWGLLKIVTPSDVDVKAKVGSVKVLSYKDKSEWKLCPKYTLGAIKRNRGSNFNR